MKKVIAVTGLILTAALTHAADTAELTAEARMQVKAFGGELKQTVQQGMKAGGPTAAIPLCNTEAPQIKARHSQGDWQVARTSSRVRNPDNVADAWEAEVLAQFEQRMAAGESADMMEASRLQDGEFRYMKAIPAGGVCMNCHGEKLTDAVTSRLHELYPEDQATGYRVGDLRGAFTLRKVIQ